MRAAEEIFKENVRGWQLGVTSKGLKAIVEAMKIYAKEAIEECAAKVKADENGYPVALSVSILSLINELK